MKCQHYKTCITLTDNYLCNDNNCILNKKSMNKEVQKNREECRQFLDEYKKSLGITIFMELNR